MKRRIIVILLFSVSVILVSVQPTKSKTPPWQVGEHPRLLATSEERTGLIAKLTQPGSVSSAYWNSFLAGNQSANTNSSAYNNADAGALYFITGNTTAGQRAHDYVMNYINNNTLIGAGTYVYDSRWWQYRDMMLSYDFAYDRFTDPERQQVLAYIAKQGIKCANADPSGTPGNINATWGACLIGSAVLLEGENTTLTITDEPVYHQSLNGRDRMQIPFNISITKVATSPGGPAAYAKNTDYTTWTANGYEDRAVDWAPAGAEPGVGTTYYVSYTFTPNVTSWLAFAKKFMEYHFNYEWHDGYYNGGFFYGAVDLEELPFLVEVSRRSLGIDYRENNDMKRAIDMYIYERLPSNDGLQYRYNMLNDSTNWYESGIWEYYGWLRRFTAWATTAFAGDPEGYDQRYRWFWTKAYRNDDGTLKNFASSGASWREAWWVNDSVLGSYPVTTVPAVTWPNYRYMRGHEVIYSHPDGLWSANQNGAALSFVSGPHNYINEHDHGDSGSFTFHAQNEDWAVDQGYGIGGGGSGGYGSIDHNTVAIDGSGYFPSGTTYGDEAGSPYFGGSTTMGQVALTDAASAISTNLTSAWTLRSVSPVENQERFVAMVSDGLPSYLVVADDVKKDSGTHNYQWLLNTHPSNTYSNEGDKQWITGHHGASSSVALVQTLQPLGTTTTWSSAANGNLGAHPQMSETASSTVNPYFLHVIMPGEVGAGRPNAWQRTAIMNGTAATMTWPDGTVDVILWRHSAGTVTFQQLVSDARLTIVRYRNNQPDGFLAISGRSVTNAGQELLTVFDGSAPVTVSAFGAVAAVDGTDASRLRIGLTQIVSAHIQDGGINEAVINDGQGAYVNAPESFRKTRAGAPNIRTESFDGSYTEDMLIYNMDLNPVDKQVTLNGSYHLQPTTYDWMGYIKRDGNARHRSAIYPNVIPPVYHDDADISFKFRFSSLDSNRALRTYFRVNDYQWGYSWPAVADWMTNQDYVRLDIQPALNQVLVGSRVNGTWTWVPDTNILSQSTATATWNNSDTSWHTARVRLVGRSMTVFIDGQQVISTTLAADVPSSGYLQWQSSGTVVDLDDLSIQTIDTSAPPGPSSGVVLPIDGNHAALEFEYGVTSDITATNVYSSSSPISAGANPATLTLEGTSVGAAHQVSISALATDRYYAAATFDQSGNHSQLVQLTHDTSSPSAVIDLHPE